MKKSILIFCTVLTTFSLTAFGYMHWSNTVTDQKETSCSKTFFFDNVLVNTFTKQGDIDLFFDVDSRFGTTITKENLNKAKSIIDILPRKATQSIVTYYSARVSILDDNQETDQRETGNSEVLNDAQIKLLQATDYSTKIYIRADYKQKNRETGELEDSYLTYFITIVPEKEAEFVNGHDALIDYLKQGSKEKTAIIKKDKLQPGKVSFTVTKEGTIANVKLTSTSGYPSVDEALVDLITNMPGKWNPAMNSKGEKVSQELVFFFGLQGC